MRTKKHPGFKAVAQGISRKEHIPMKRANAIVAAGARHASPGAKAANPRLAKVYAH